MAAQVPVWTNCIPVRQTVRSYIPGCSRSFPGFLQKSPLYVLHHIITCFQIKRMDYYRDQSIYPQGDRILIQKQVFSQKGVHLCGCKSNIYHSLSLSFTVWSQTVEGIDSWVCLCIPETPVLSGTETGISWLPSASIQWEILQSRNNTPDVFLWPLSCAQVHTSPPYTCDICHTCEQAYVTHHT